MVGAPKRCLPAEQPLPPEGGGRSGPLALAATSRRAPGQALAAPLTPHTPHPIRPPSLQDGQFVYPVQDTGAYADQAAYAPYGPTPVKPGIMARY